METELAELDGINVCRQIRKVSDVPIIVLSSRSAQEDRVLAFELGADDYVLKPFFPRELMARVRVFLRRSGMTQLAPAKRFSFNGLYIDTASRTVYIDERVIQLTPKEYDLLFFLSRIRTRLFRARRC
jgi:two-component system response regulator ResD